MDLSKNLERWKSSGEPETWVQTHPHGWNHSDWLELLVSLSRSQYWPMEEAAIGQHLEMLRQPARERQAMSQADLPQKLFVPSVRTPQGALDLQIRDENNRMVILVWGNLESAARWLQPHGLELWRKQRGSLPSGEIIIREAARDELLIICKHVRTRLHFEPDVGSLFSPADRQIEP